MKSKDRQAVEATTKNLYPRIHRWTSRNELEAFKKLIHTALNTYIFHQSIRNPVLGKRVLEVGCGGRASGIYAISVLKPASITAVDLSQENVKLTQKVVSSFGIQNVTVTTGNVLSLDFPTDSFDFVLCDGVLHHTVDAERGFRELVRVTRRGGYILIGVYGHGGFWGRVVHPLGVKLGKIIPLRLTEAVVNKTGLLRSQDNSLLDWFYTPIQEFYSPDHIRGWFLDASMTNERLIVSSKWFFNLGFISKLLFGHGYLFAMGRKAE